MMVVEAIELYRFYHTGSDETFALRGVSLGVAAGEIVAIVGPSGSGKSTLLACLAGLDEPSGGHVEVMGHRLSRRSEPERSRQRSVHIGVLPQCGNLFAHLTVSENIRFQITENRPERRAAIRELMAALDLDRVEGRVPAQLSGGERARAGLAVALVNDPELLIADEPTAEVDRATESIIFDLLAARRLRGRAMLLASHSLVLAQRADRVLTLRDGRLIDG
jgi:putative ABC transport system ATP-binding protein